MSLFIALTSSPFGPLTETTLSAETATVTPAGIAIGNLPTLDIIAPPVLLVLIYVNLVTFYFGNYQT